MKSKKFLKTFLLYLFSLLFVCSTILKPVKQQNYNTNVNMPQKMEEIGEFNNLKYSSYWTVPNINITNWTTTNKTYDWCNYENGYYIIENVTITGVPGKNGILIINTTENFIIRNCQINEGISLWRVSNGRIINNNISLGQAYLTGMTIKIGIYMGLCLNFTIKHNIINGTAYYSSAIMLYICNNIKISENTISNNDYIGSLSSIGLDIQGTEKIMVINNTIFNGDHGVRIDGNNHTISNNTIKNCYCGLSLRGLNYLIHNNKLYNNRIGVRARASYSTFSNNFIQHFNDYGFYFEESNYNIISNNSIQKPGKYGIYLKNSNHSSITGNYITCKVSCIVEIDCYGNIFSNNICRKTPELIFGYYPWMVLGILIITTLIILKIKLKEYE